MQEFPSKTDRTVRKGVTHMTAVFVFAALLLANYLFTRWDGKCLEEARRLEDFRRIECKKCYEADSAWLGRI